MTYSKLNKCLQELKQQAANIQVEGDTLTNARIDSSKPGGKSVRNPSIQYRLRVNGQPSRYLKASEVTGVRAAIARGKQLKKIEQGIQHITSQLEQIEKQALAMGLELPKVKSHDCSVMHSSESNEWYTLQKSTDKARKLMGELTLDPASNVEAQSWIEATHYYTKEQDGMNLSWFGCVWLNPPYGKRSLKDGVYGSTAWILKAIAEFEAGNVTQAVLWLRAGGNKGIQALEDKGFPRIVLGRENHAPPGAGGKPQKGAGHDTVVYYLGPHVERFKELFGREQ